MDINGLDIEYVEALENEEIRDSVEYAHKQYGINDCMLVRATDIFPTDGVIKTPVHANACGYGDSSILGEAINTVLREKYPNAGFDEAQSEAYTREKVQTQVVFETMRSTIHFCINGVVGSHAQGNFQNRNFIILEPLKYHMDDSLKGMRVEDAYYNDDMNLSNEAVIMINVDMFNQMNNNVDFLTQLKGFKVVVYKGNEQVALRKVFENLGYDSFVVSGNGYVNGISQGTAANAMWEMCGNYAVEHGISVDRHFTSQINQEDREKRMEKAEITDKEHFNYLLANTNIPEQLKADIEACLTQGIERNDKLQELTLEFVKLVGLDTISQLTQQFNADYVSKLKQNDSSKTM